jgi:SAM-dependent methyltransferase
VQSLRESDFEESMMQFDPQYVQSWYDEYGDQESQRWSKSSAFRMQYEIYVRHLRQRVRPGDRVLDCGSGPGTYARIAMEIGARVTCLDLSPVQLAACRELAQGADDYVLGTITDLSRFADASFDVCLALGGPLSYCFDQVGRAIRELSRIIRPGGLLGVSVMSLHGALHHHLRGVLDLPLESNRRIVASGDLPREVSGHECHMFRVAEFAGLLTDAGLVDVELSASGFLIPLVPYEGLNLPETGSAEWEWLLEAELAASVESPGAGTHIIAWASVPS